MRDILDQIIKWQDAGETFSLATVVSTYHSAPREAGAAMAVSAGGEVVGSVSGGCVEGAVITEAIEVIEAGAPRVLEFGVADETAWRAGLSCGGRIRVFVERVD